MSDAITPALTPAQWRVCEVDRDGTTIAAAEESVFIREADTRSEVIVLPDDVHALMALANAALPDGDPRKLTREDVALIRGERFGGFKDDAPALWRAMDALAAKLAALLPPEPSHG